MNLSYRNQRNAQIVAEYYRKPLDKPDWYSVRNLESDEAEIFIYDFVGWPFNDAGELVQIISGIKDTPILARINSPGGDVWDGMAILNAFVNHPSGVTVRIESLAASIASVLAMGGREVQAYSNTMMMIHNAWVLVAGNKEELIETSKLLGQIDENILGAYTAKTKLGKKEVRDMMTRETWMNTKEMKEKGFIDTIIEAGKPAKAQFDLSMFANAPENILSAYDNGGKDLTTREVERALRDGGASRNFAKAFVAGRNESDNQRDADSLENEEKDQANQREAEIAQNLKTIITKVGGGH